jgi:hypothetical protein
VDKKEKSFLDIITSPLTGDYRKNKPISVKAADVAVDMTPVGSAVDIAEELGEEDPSYAKIGLIAAGDVLGTALPAAGPVVKSLIKQSDNIESVWSYPKQLYDSAETSINVSKKPAGYNELKKRGDIKDGDLIVDIGGGKFDNLVEDAAEEGASVKVYDPFNRTPEHNAQVVDIIKDGQADMAMSHNVLNVIQEDKNIIDIAVQAENAIKPNGKAHFSVYEGTGKGIGKVTSKGYQRNEKTQAYVPLIEQVFGEGNVTRKGKIITATKNVQGFSEGGMALEEQMAMNFGDVPDNTIGVDPVSGNEIPMGSTAENVRDDIPANLSEGEIVMAADVVNFHGVKLFEDLRAEAKMGYAKMADDGRIGGEPMEEDMSDIGIEITLEDLKLQDTEQREEAFLGKFFDEGGLATDEELSVMPVDTEPTPVETKKPTRKIYERKGGFDMDAIANKPRVQIYEYVNAEGHRIFITYIDNVPQSQIPPGYVLSGEPTDINSIYYDPENPDPTEPTDPEDPENPEDPEVPPEEGGTTTTSGGGGGGSSGSANTDTPEPFNYKELTMEELKDLVDEMTSFGSKLAGLNPITKIAVKLSHNQTRKEIERRLTDPNVSEVDKMRYRNLLELSNRKQPNLIATVGDFISGNTTQRKVDQIPKPKIPDVDYSDPTLAPTPYTPDVQTSNKMTTPGVDEDMPSGYSNEIKTQIEQASADAASVAFGSPSKTVKPVGNDDFIEDVKKDPDSFLPPTSTNDNNDSPIFRPPTPAPKPSPIYDNVAAGDYNDDSTGVYKGGMMRKKKKSK